MNNLIEGQDRQLSTMLEEILIAGDPDRSRNANSHAKERDKSDSDESSALLEPDNESSSPPLRRRPIRGSTTFPDSTPSSTGSQASAVPPRPNGITRRQPAAFSIEADEHDSGALPELTCLRACLLRPALYARADGSSGPLCFGSSPWPTLGATGGTVHELQHFAAQCCRRPLSLLVALRAGICFSWLLL